jgi:hypothetical protein
MRSWRWLLAFGRAVLFDQGASFFALRAKNEAQKVGKYLAAAGVVMYCAGRRATLIGRLPQQ